MSLERWESQRAMMSFIAGTAGVKKTPEQVRPLWVDDVGRAARMKELDTLVSKNEKLINYFKNNGNKRQ